MATPSKDPTLTLHQMHMSGNSYKIRLTASFLGLHFAKIHNYDTIKGETRTPEYLAHVSAAGRVPVLQIGNDTFLPESNAACYYLADDNDPNSPATKNKRSVSLIPRDRLQHARMLQWMFFEQYSHEPYIAVLRYWRKFLGEGNLDEMQRMSIPGKERQAVEALNVMEGCLSEEGREWFVGESVSLADVVLFAYTHRLHEAGMDIGRWPAVERWVERVKGVEGYVRMEE